MIWFLKSIFFSLSLFHFPIRFINNCSSFNLHSLVQLELEWTFVGELLLSSFSSSARFLLRRRFSNTKRILSSRHLIGIWLAHSLNLIWLIENWIFSTSPSFLRSEQFWINHGFVVNLPYQYFVAQVSYNNVI